MSVCRFLRCQGCISLSRNRPLTSQPLKQLSVSINRAINPVISLANYSIKGFPRQQYLLMLHAFSAAG